MLTLVSSQLADDIELADVRTSIGRHQSNHVVLSSAQVSDFHAEFHLVDDGVYLVDLGSETGTFLNGERVNGRVKVGHNDQLAVGDVAFTLIDPEALARENAPVDEASSWLLIPQAGASLGRRVVLQGIMVVGREAERDICIPAEEISRQHARFELSGDQLKLTDLGSANGTTVNGVGITDCLLKDGDVVCFDKEAYLIQAPRPATPPVAGQHDAMEAAADKTMIRRPRPEWYLEAGGEAHLQGEIALDGVMVVGREEQRDICIPVAHVSRQHARFEFRGEALFLVDLDSANGTFVNGERISERQLTPGDVIRFDIEEYILHGPAPAAEVVDADKTQIRMPARQDRQADGEEASSAAVDVDPDVAVDFPLDDAPAETVEASAPEVDFIVDAGGEADSTVINETAGADAAVQQAATAEPAASGFEAIAEGATRFGDDWQTTQPDAVDDSKTVLMPGGGQAALASSEVTDCPQELIYENGPMAGQKIGLSGEELAIGRTAANDIRLTDPSVSSQHAIIRRKDGRWHIQDLDSYKGVRVNKRKCRSRTLNSGDIIHIGEVRFVFYDKTGEATASGGGVPWLKLLAVLSIVAMAGLAYRFLPGLLKQVDLDLDMELPEIPAILTGASPLQPVWTKTLPSRDMVGNALIVDINRDGVDDVVVAGEAGAIELFDGDSGTALGRIATGLTLYSEPALIQDGRQQHALAVVSESGELRSYSLQGELLWQNDRDLQGQSLYLPVVTATVDDDETDDLVVITDNGGMNVFSGKDGHLLAALEPLDGEVVAKPLVADLNADGITDVVLVVGGRQSDQQRVAAYSVQGKRAHKLWEKTIPPVLHAMVRFAKKLGLVYISTQDNGLLALNSQTGSKIWQSQISGMLFSEAALLDTDADGKEDALIQTTVKGEVTALRAFSGERLWTQSLAADTQAPALGVSLQGEKVGQVFILAVDGTLHILDMVSGERLTTEKIADNRRFTAPPTVATSRGRFRLIATDQSGGVYVFGLAGEQ